MAIDPNCNFLLSGSPDSTIHVWSLPALLSFAQPSSTDPTQPSPRSPLRSLSHHRAAITHLVLGHSTSTTNIAVSASRDNTCMVWDYHAGIPLKTFLLPSTPLSLALDPADRAVYAGHEDGSIQLLHFYQTPALTNPLYDPAHQSTPSNAAPKDRWPPPPNATIGAVLSLTLNYDGTTLLSGHQSGKILSWDVAKGRYSTELADVGAPVTNLRMLPPTGFPRDPKPTLTVHSVVKPRYEAALSSVSGEGGSAPASYNFSAHFTSALDLPRVEGPVTTRQSAFDAALGHVCFPAEVLDEGLRELAAWDQASTSTSTSAATGGKSIPFAGSFDGATDDHHERTSPATSEIADLKSQIADLNALVQSQHQTQKWTWEKLLELNTYRYEREKKDRDRGGGGGLERIGKMEGNVNGVQEMDEDDEMDEDEADDDEPTP